MNGLNGCTQLILLLLAPHAHFSAQNSGDEGGSGLCQLQEAWRGEYFKSGDRDPFLVTRQYFGTEGSCYRKHSDGTFLLFSREQRCYRCIQVWKQHNNCLQYKLGMCKKYETPGDDSCLIEDHTQFSTIVRLNGENTPCPFQGPFSFTYKEGGKECSAPKSQISECVDRSQALLRFGICPDSVQTETAGNVFYQTVISLEGDPEETLTCKATWAREDDPTETYMLGTLDYRYKRTEEERVRCFLVKETKRGIQVAQSSNSSCSADLHSSTAGYRTLKLTREDTGPAPCLFPAWAEEMDTLYSFSYSSVYQFIGNGTILSFSNYSATTNRSHELSRSVCVSVEEEEEEVSTRLVVHTVAGCDLMYKCLTIYRRTDHVLEIQEGSPTIHESEACSEINFDEQRTMFMTLFRASMDRVVCPISGIHNVTGLFLNGKTEQCENQGFTSINIRCGDEKHFLQFYQECPSEDGLRIVEGPRSNYICQGGWETSLPLSDLPNYTPRVLPDSLEGAGLFISDSDPESYNITLGYLVAAQEFTPNKRICFIYTRTDTAYFWTVDKTSCLRNIRPGWEGRQRFNTTVLETCAATTAVYSTWLIAGLLLVNTNSL